MCGIAGIIGKPTSNEIVSMLKHLQVRGIDATGVSLNCPDICRILKAAIDADIFCSLPNLRQILDEYTKTSTIALLHTRLATNGTPLNNYNNHPIWNDKGIIIHNGIVWVRDYYRYETNGETDTEQLLEAITNKGLFRAIRDCSGILAIAYQNFQNRHVVYLYRCGEPLHLGRKNGNIYFCSTPKILRKSIGKYDRIRLEDRTIYRIDAEEMSIEEVGKVNPNFSW